MGSDSTHFPCLPFSLPSIFPVCVAEGWSEIVSLPMLAGFEGPFNLLPFFLYLKSAYGHKTAAQSDLN